jgi:hypothetical protein
LIVDTAVATVTIRDQWPGIVLGALLGGVLGFAFARLLDRLRARDARRESAKQLVSLSDPMLRRVEQCRDHFDRASEVDADAVAAYFRTEVDFVAAGTLDDLRQAISTSVKLDHSMLNAWRRAHEQLDDARRSHNTQVSLVRAAGVIPADKRTSYRQHLAEATDAMRHALRLTRRACHRGSMVEIDRLLRE